MAVSDQVEVREASKTPAGCAQAARSPRHAQSRQLADHAAPLATPALVYLLQIPLIPHDWYALR
jgi:hypothetical protein